MPSIRPASKVATAANAAGAVVPADAAVPADESTSTSEEVPNPRRRLPLCLPLLVPFPASHRDDELTESMGIVEGW
jgi:hypothetical protein